MNKLQRTVRVTPLSEKAWARVERGVFDAVDALPVGELRVDAEPARKPVWPFVATGLAAVAVVLLVVLVLRPAHEQLAANEPSWVVTEGSPSHVLFGENELDVAARSAVLVSGDDARGVLVVLDRGGVECEVAPRKHRPPFVVHAGPVRVRVVGTRFSVTRHDGDVAVHVTHGVVEVSRGLEVVRLTAGQTWREREDTTPRNASQTSTGHAESAAPRTPSAPSPVVAPSHRVHEHAEPVGGRAAVVDLPHAVQTSRESGRHGSSASSSSSTAQVAPSSRELARPVSSAPSAASSPQSLSATPAADSELPTASRSALFEQASRLEARAPGDAVRIYGQLARGRDLWAANALFAQARLELERGHPEAARQLSAQYLARFPNGPNAADAAAMRSAP